MVQKLLPPALDVLEALGGEVVVAQRLDQARRPRVDGNRGLPTPSGAERVYEFVRAQHQAVAVRGSGLA
ncbi:hypothetical protein, partial [Burkholderia pseudomallei]|uniref:hypothetical protein n=1 Tax=Burkholderia pseudomallei TaxID=28450 RepID=UPI003F683DA8